MRFTLFNVCTFLVVVMALLAAVSRRREGAAAALPLLSYAVFVGYALGFSYSVNLYVILAGVAIALVMRWRKWEAAWWLDVPVFGYVVWRGVILLAGF